MFSKRIKIILHIKQVFNKNWKNYSYYVRLQQMFCHSFYNYKINRTVLYSSVPTITQFCSITEMPCL